MSSKPKLIPFIACQQLNHHKRPFEYICLRKQCLRNNKYPLCFYCLKQWHEQHLAQTMSLNQFISRCQNIAKSHSENLNQKTNKQHQSFYKLQNILLSSFSLCKQKQQLKGILQQTYESIFILGSSNQQPQRRIQNLINAQANNLKDKVQLFYSNLQGDKDQVHKSKKNLTKSTKFGIPIISFKTQSILSQNFKLISPFEIRHTISNTISTNLAYPSLSTFSQSVQVYIKISRLTPNWLGIGIVMGEKKYQQESKSHITVLSNGWINHKGQLQKQSGLKFQTGHTIKISWNKQKQLFSFKNMSSKNQYAFRFSTQWNQDIYFFVTMFFKDDSVAILHSNE